MKQAFYPLHKLNIARAWQESTYVQAFFSVSGCQTCMCKRGINFQRTRKNFNAKNDNFWSGRYFSEIA